MKEGNTFEVKKKNFICIEVDNSEDLGFVRDSMAQLLEEFQLDETPYRYQEWQSMNGFQRYAGDDKEENTVSVTIEEYDGRVISTAVGER